jgi:SAM-dependent methyltransferase
VPEPAWYFDEAAHAGPEHLDPAYVGGYDGKAGYDPAPDLARLRTLGLDEGSTVVDLGCGTGAFAAAAAAVCRRVVAVDVSKPMIAAAVSRVQGLGLRNVECVRAGFLTYAHRGEPADVVYSRHALHHLPDFWKAVALERIRSILRPGGVFHMRDLVYGFDPADADEVLGRWFARGSARADVGWTRAELETHVRDEYSTFTWLLEPMLERAGLRIEEAERADSRTYATYTCVRAR